MANIHDKPRFYDVAAGSLLARYIRFVWRTSWQTREMTESFEDHEGNHPCIIGMWHGQFMLLPLIRMSDVPVDVMLARHGDAEALGQTLKHFDMQLIRGAGAGSPRQRPRRHPRLPRRRAVAARWPHGGHDGRRAGRGGAACGTWHRHGRAPVGTADPAGRHRHLALYLVQHLEPDDDQPALLGHRLCRRSACYRAARGSDPSSLRRYRQAVEDGLNIATELAYQRASADPTRATPLAARNGGTEPGLRLKAYRVFTSLARPVAPALLRLRERHGKEDPARRPERLGRAERCAARPAGSPGSMPPASARPMPSCR